MSDISVRMTLKDEVSSKLDKIKSSATTTARQFSNAGKAMDEAFHSSAASDFASQAENAFSSATSGAEALGDAINEVNSAYDDLGSSAGAYQDVNGRWHDANGKFIKSLGTTGEKIKDIDETLSGLGDDTGGLEGLSSQIGDAGTSMEQASAHAINFGSALKTLFAVAGGATVLNKIKEFGVESVDTFSGLQTGMAEVSTLISGSTKAEMAGMTSQVREFSLNTGKLADEVVPALYQSISASVPKESVFDFLETANMAAVGGVTEMETAVDGITSVINAYGTENISAAEASDQMFTAVKLGKTTFGDLAGSLYNVIPTAVNAGISFGDVTAAIATMTAAGTPTSVATTQIRQALVELSDTGTDVGETFQSIAGKSFKEFIAEGHNTSEALKLLDTHAKESGLSIDQLFSSVEAGAAATGLTGINADVFTNDIEAMKSSAGATEEAYEKMTDTFQHKKDLMAAAIEDVKIDSGEALAEGLSPAIDGLLENMDEIKEPTVEFFSAIGDIIADLAPLLPGFLNTLSNGAEALGDVIGPLAKLMANNPEAIGTGLTGIATGMMAFKGLNAASGTMKSLEGVKGLSGALSKLAPTIFSNPWTTGAAAVTGAITAIGFAMKEYSDMQIEDSLETHFGSVSLNDSQIEDFASKIIDAEWLVNVDVSLGHFENAEEFTEQAEQALSNNDSLEWKARVGIKLTEDERSSYMQNIEDFKSNIEQALTEQTVAANMVVSEFNLKSADGVSLGSKIEEWAKADLGEIEYLSSGLTNLVQNALQNGIIDVDEQAAIDELQSKINNIMEGWQEAEAQAELDMLTQKYGRLSGADLDSGTFSKVVEELGEQRETATAALEASEKKLYTTLNALNRKDEYGVQKISDEELFSYKSQAGQAIRNEEASMIGNSLRFEVNTLSDTYGEKLEANYADMQSSTARFFENANALWAEQDYAGLTDSFRNGFTSAMTGTNWFSSGDQKALAGIYEQMKPDVESMAGVIDEYRELGQAVPRDVWDEFNSAVQVGAAAGDVDAAWQVLANEWITTPANKALKQAVLDGKITVPEGFRKALERIPTELTDEPLTIEGMQADVENFKVNREHVDELLTQAFEGLEATGDVVTINGTAAVEYEVTAGQTMSEIASECGLALEELISANPQIENPNVINVGQKINIPASACSVDASGVSAATEEAVRSQTGEPIEREQPVTNVLTDAGTDASQVVSTTQSEVDNAFSSSLPADGTVDVSLEKGNDNVAAVYSSVGDIVKNAWSQPYSASGSVNVVLTANYSLANPSATINFGGGATGSAAVTAALHAEGGIFDTPHYGVFAEAGPEAFIPIDGSDNAKAIWQETGIRLGLLQDEAPISIAPTHSIGTSRSNESVTGSGSDSKLSSKEINLNINGSGNMRIDGGVQKEDVLNMMVENIKDVLLEIIEQEILEEGDGVYEY